MVNKKGYKGCKVKYFYNNESYFKFIKDNNINVYEVQKTDDNALKVLYCWKSGPRKRIKRKKILESFDEFESQKPKNLIELMRKNHKISL